MEPATMMAIGAGVLKGVGGILGNKAAKKKKKASKKREEAALISAFLARRQAIVDYRQAQAMVLAGGLASGAGIESSGIQGSQASLRAQITSVLSRNAEQITLGRQANKLDRKAASIEATAAMFNVAGDIMASIGKTLPMGPRPGTLGIGGKINPLGGMGAGMGTVNTSQLMPSSGQQMLG